MKTLYFRLFTIVCILINEYIWSVLRVRNIIHGDVFLSSLAIMFIGILVFNELVIRKTSNDFAWLDSMLLLAYCIIVLIPVMFIIAKAITIHPPDLIVGIYQIEKFVHEIYFLNPGLYLLLINGYLCFTNTKHEKAK